MDLRSIHGSQQLQPVDCTFQSLSPGPSRRDPDAVTLAPQRQVTLTALLQTQHVLARGHFTEGQGFERMVCLVDVALRSTSLSELQALQQEAQASRPSPESGGVLMVRPQEQTELYRVGTVEMIWIASMAVAVVVTPFLACTWGP